MIWPARAMNRLRKALSAKAQLRPVSSLSVEAAGARRRIRRTLIAACGVALLLSLRHMGFVALFVAVPLSLWLAYSVYAIATRPERRSDQTIRVAAWIAAMTAIAASHAYLHVSTRSRADALVAAIRQHLSTSGDCPTDLTRLGLDPGTLRARLGMSYFSCQGGKVFFAYAATFIVFEMYVYDFEQGAWRLRGS